MRIVVLFLLFFSLPGWSLDIFGSIEELVELYQEVEKTGTDYAKSDEYLNSDYYQHLMWLQEKPRMERRFNQNLREYYQSCPGCPDVLPLAESVNDIVQQLAEQEDQQNPNAHLLERVSSLELMLGIVVHLSKPLEGGGCYTLETCSNGDLRPIIDESTVLLFKTAFDTNKLQGITIRQGQRQDYYYRANIDGHGDDIILHLIVDELGRSSLEYYSKTEHIEEQDEPQVSPTPRPPDGPDVKRPDDVYGAWYGFQRAGRTPETRSNYIQGHVALAMELPRGGGFPERFHLADINTQVGKTNAELTATSDEIAMGITHQMTEDDSVTFGASTNFGTMEASLAFADSFIISASSDMSFDEFSAKVGFPAQFTFGTANFDGENYASYELGDTAVTVGGDYTIHLPERPELTIKASGSTEIDLDPNADQRVPLNTIGLESRLQINPDSSITMTFEYESDDYPSVGIIYTLRK